MSVVAMLQPTCTFYDDEGLQMLLLKAKGSGMSLHQPTGLMSFGATFPWFEDGGLCLALHAANINILRRDAPYLYVFQNANLVEMNTGMPEASDPYVKTLERKQLGRGIWLADPDFGQNTRTWVTAVLQGDVLPFVSWLDNADVCLLALPCAMPLTEIDDIIVEAPSVQESLITLLSSGGFVLTLTDHFALDMKSTSSVYAKYFVTSTKMKL